jgi:formylmethanofuran dehydrogenase subunit A
LGIGADADIAIYDLDPKQEYSNAPDKLVRIFAQAWMTIKDGIVVQKTGKMVATPKGRTYWIDAQVAPDLAATVEQDLRQKFEKYYTVQFDNYPVSKAYLHRSAPIRLSAKSAA